MEARKSWSHVGYCPYPCFPCFELQSNDNFPLITDAKQYVPGRDRSRPYALELLVSLPPRSVTEIYLEFDYSFLKWQEYPPDANHGFYVGAAVITALLPHTKNYTGLPIDGSTFSSR